jgi:ribosomal protein L11 methyltransferase
MSYTQYRFFFENPNEELIDILIAFLSSEGYEGFQLEENHLLACIADQNIKTGFPETIVSDPVFSYLELSFDSEPIPDKNWNEEWESSYEPVIVDDICAIVAPFHKPPSTNDIITIEPKMSFGTGHHETTRLMIRQMHRENLKDAKVLDMGCGTAILSIYALLRGANHITAIDIDTWACENSRENFLRNNFDDSSFKVIPGDSGSIPDEKYDFILANINRNVLLTDMPLYHNYLKEKGVLILSGIFISDLEDIKKAALSNDFSYCDEDRENQWISAKFRK